MIITGVGGQGNILISRLIGQTLVDDGYLCRRRRDVRGLTEGRVRRKPREGSSKKTACSPLTPGGCADIVLGLEPLESLRILTLFGNESSVVITNTRVVHTMAVVIGDAEYPRLDTIKGVGQGVLGGRGI